MNPQARYKGLRIPLPQAIQGQAQLAFATPMVVGQSLILGPLVTALTGLFPPIQDPVLKAWMRGVLLWSGVDLVVEGDEQLDPQGRYVFVSNHQSHFDVPCVSSALPVPVRFVAKRSLAKIPVFGAAMRAVGTVVIDRDDRSDTMRRLKDAQRGVAQRCSLHFFAEGTRSQDGQLRPFKKGAAAMALALQIPLVPVAVSGTRHIYPKGTVKLKPGTGYVSIGRPIPPGREDTAEERSRLTREVRAEVQRMLLQHGEPVDEPNLERDPVGHQEVLRGR
ncbi:MAG: 1-acylglycerol-3-phosphate O-acyltransferase [Deltaproteobacteria bacterium]|nr:1-acylglycerol-3-phosphate O-acyltransferase [Deltaproteobacteria bacterium]